MPDSMMGIIQILQRPDLNKPIDKHIYKGTIVPVCHDFNQMTTDANRLDLLVGFSSGAIQHLNPLKKESLAVFNDDVSLSYMCSSCVVVMETICNAEL